MIKECIGSSVFSLFLSFWLSAAVLAQTSPTPPKETDEIIRVDTQTVDVPVSVTGANDRPVRDLRQANFAVFEDGKQQVIESFSTVAAPFEIALVLDTSGSTRSDLQLIKRAAQDFVGLLRAGDRVSVSAFASTVRDGQTQALYETLSPLTGDRDALRSAIDAARTSSGTPYYDSLVNAVNTAFASPPRDEVRGRRALVVLSDGVDSTSVADFEEARSVLTKAGIVTYFIKVDTRSYFEAELLGDCQSATRFSPAQIRRYYFELNPKARVNMSLDFCQLGDFERLAISKRLYEIADDEMNALARSSGGRVFAARDLSEARRAFRDVADEIGTQFTISYSPTNDRHDGKYRKIKVELKGTPTGTKVRFREGYTAPAN